MKLPGAVARSDQGLASREGVDSYEYLEIFTSNLLSTVKTQQIDNLYQPIKKDGIVSRL